MALPSNVPLARRGCSERSAPGRWCPGRRGAARSCTLAPPRGRPAPRTRARSPQRGGSPSSESVRVRRDCCTRRSASKERRQGTAQDFACYPSPGRARRARRYAGTRRRGVPAGVWGKTPRSVKAGWTRTLSVNATRRRGREPSTARQSSRPRGTLEPAYGRIELRVGPNPHECRRNKALPRRAHHPERRGAGAL
jgi:hypothetical protein